MYWSIFAKHEHWSRVSAMIPCRRSSADGLNPESSSSKLTPSSPVDDDGSRFVSSYPVQRVASESLPFWLWYQADNRSLSIWQAVLLNSRSITVAWMFRQTIGEIYECSDHINVGMVALNFQSISLLRKHRTLRRNRCHVVVVDVV